MKKDKQEKYYNKLEIRREANLKRYKDLEMKSFEKWQKKLKELREEEEDKRALLTKYFPNC